MPAPTISEPPELPVFPSGPGLPDQPRVFFPKFLAFLTWLTSFRVYSIDLIAYLEGLTVGGGGSGDMLAANNLSDVANTATALDNLGGQPSDADLTALAGLSLAQGDILYRDASGLQRLAAGTSGHFLKTLGAGADPAWAAGVTPAFRGALVWKSSDQTGANYSSGLPISFNTEEYDTDSIYPIATTVTITIASPGVVTWTGHTFINGSPIVFTTTGALPTGLTAGTTYYIVNKATNTFQVAATPGGSAINTTGSQSGVHTATNYSCLVVPSGVTKVRLVGNVFLSSVAASEDIYLDIRKNGVQFVPGLPNITARSSIGFPRAHVSSAVMTPSAGDYFQLFLTTTADTSITVTATGTWFAMEIIE